MPHDQRIETQLKHISVQGLVKLRNCADRLIAEKLRNERIVLRQQLARDATLRTCMQPTAPDRSMA